MKQTDEFLELAEKSKRDKYWDIFYKTRVNGFVLITNNNTVLAAYEQMKNGKNTDFFANENDYVN